LKLIITFLLFVFIHTAYLNSQSKNDWENPEINASVEKSVWKVIYEVYGNGAVKVIQRFNPAGDVPPYIPKVGAEFQIPEEYNSMTRSAEKIFTKQKISLFDRNSNNTLGQLYPVLVCPAIS